MTYNGPYDYCGNCEIPIFQSQYTMECAELPLHALLQFACRKNVTYLYEYWVLLIHLLSQHVTIFFMCPRENSVKIGLVHRLQLILNLYPSNMILNVHFIFLRIH